RAPGLQRREPGARAARGAAARHRQDGHPRLDPAQAGEAHRRGVGDHAAPPGLRGGAALPHRVPGAGAAHPALAPREVGRQRLPARATGRGDPAAGAHLRGRRRVRRADLGAPLPPGALAAGGARVHRVAERQALRPERGGRVRRHARLTGRRACSLSGFVHAGPPLVGRRHLLSLPGPAPGGPASTVGTYSRSWSLPSNVRLAVSARATSGQASKTRLRPLLPVITGNTTRRIRSTRPASRSGRQRLMLPSVRSGRSPSRFMARTASTASPLTSSVLGQGRGASSVEENTTFGTAVRPARLASSSGEKPPLGG